jgi:N-acetylglutamate synthase-like GNAT family acetyltransferase
MKIRTAINEDKPFLTGLINEAYQVAKFFKYEDRMNEEEMNRYFSTGTFLVLEDPDETIACIYYRLVGNSLNFSLLSVDPKKQGKGFSKILVKRVEEIACENACELITIQVVNLRKPLFPFYQHLGFVPMGTKPFPKPTKLPCHLVDMVKNLECFSLLV